MAHATRQDPEAGLGKKARARSFGGITKRRDYSAMAACLLISGAISVWVLGGPGLPATYLVIQILLLVVCVRYWRGQANSGVDFTTGLVALAIGIGLIIADLPLVGPGSEHQTIKPIMQNLWAVSLYGLGLSVLAWTIIQHASRQEAQARGWMPSVYLLFQPLFFGIWLLVIWEFCARVFQVPTVLMPPPSLIRVAFVSNVPTLYADFVQTIVRAVIPGYIMGCGIGLLTAVLIDRSPFLRRGLVPTSNFLSSLPLVGIAPIAVMWFGFDWQSKAAVVVIMTFFPMLVNMIAGLEQTSRLERDLMRSWAASGGQILRYLRFPAALPFLFNALKINSTLAIIGAIVAEFFGTPIVGIGFRISSEVGRLNIPMVWAEILLSMICGCAFYGGLALLERRFTFWSPALRSKA